MGHGNGQPGGNSDHGRVQRVGSMVQRTVSVTGSGGVTATVVVTVRQGLVWLSIQPPFTWESIMPPGKVDELVRTLRLAADDGRKMVSGVSATGDGTPPAGNGTVTPEHNTVGMTKEES